MTSHTISRLNRLPERVLERDVLEGRGLGNELAFFIFEYERDEEILIRHHIEKLLAKVEQLNSSVRIASINLTELIFTRLQEEDLIERAEHMEANLGTSKMLENLRHFCTSQDIAKSIISKHLPDSVDIYLVHGVGSAFPILRAHGVLSALHSRIEGRPLILFFPGKFTGTRLVLFDQIQDDHYYRAFRLFGEK